MICTKFPEKLLNYRSLSYHLWHVSTITEIGIEKAMYKSLLKSIASIKRKRFTKILPSIHAVIRSPVKVFFKLCFLGGYDPIGIMPKPK